MKLWLNDVVYFELSYDTRYSIIVTAYRIGLQAASSILRSIHRPDTTAFNEPKLYAASKQTCLCDGTGIPL